MEEEVLARSYDSRLMRRLLGYLWPYRALIAAALIGDIGLAQQLQAALGDRAPRHIADALGELAGRSGRLQLGSASIAIAELARRGFLDLAKLRAATAGTPAANAL